MTRIAATQHAPMLVPGDGRQRSRRLPAQAETRLAGCGRRGLRELVIACSTLRPMKESAKKPKRFDKKAHGRKMARTVIGQPKPKIVIPSKKDKIRKRQPKHKKPILPEGNS